MQNLINQIKTFVRDEDGVTAIEYGLIAALIACVIIVSVQLVGNHLNAVFNYIAGQVNAPNAGG